VHSQPSGGWSIVRWHLKAIPKATLQPVNLALSFFSQSGVVWPYLLEKPVFEGCVMVRLSLGPFDFIRRHGK
jgi:hypothetical protein